MPIYQLTLLQRQQVANNTFQFDFIKPAGFTFTPGQYGGFTLVNPPEIDAGGITRRFSILSIPEDEHIAIAMRIQQSAYKRVLKELPYGSILKFAGPTGTFTLHEDKTIPAVLIAGGIGITPFYSMIRHACLQQSQQQIILFYGNQTASDAAYLSELKNLAQVNPNFKLVAVMANPEESWQGHKGFISYELIKQYINELALPIYYVCGSAVMVNAMQEMLDELGIEKANIKVEDFPGY
jgi:ferredoxin-NADP reductase